MASNPELVVFMMGQLASAAHIAGVPADDISRFVLVTMSPDGDIKVDVQGAEPDFAVRLLTEAVDMLTDPAAEFRLLTG